MQTLRFTLRHSANQLQARTAWTLPWASTARTWSSSASSLKLVRSVPTLLKRKKASTSWLPTGLFSPCWFYSSDRISRPFLPWRRASQAEITSSTNWGRWITTGRNCSSASKQSSRMVCSCSAKAPPMTSYSLNLRKGQSGTFSAIDFRSFKVLVLRLRKFYWKTRRAKRRSSLSGWWHTTSSGY